MTTTVPTTLTVETPIGLLTVTLAQGEVRAAAFAAAGRRGARATRGAPRGPGGPAERALARSLRAYFEGDLAALDGEALAPEGTPFQREVWAALRRIPAGEVRSYGELAAALGRPGAARAVGGACARNPVALLVPCHRAVGAGGALTGYAFGLARKRWLLAHEGARLR